MSTATSPSGARYEKLPPPATSDPPPTAPGDETVGQLIAQVSEQTARLVRDEIALAKLEARSKVKVLGMGLGAFGVAGGLAFFGACSAVTAAILGFANVMQPWLAAVVVAGICFLLALFVVLPGWRGITSTGRTPPDAIQSVRDDVSAVRHAVRHT